MVTVLIVAGAGATAMCADLGSRTVREEIDAMEVLGHQPRSTVGDTADAGLRLGGVVAQQSGRHHRHHLGGYVFSIFIQGVNPGAFAAGITLLTGVPEVIISCVKAGPVRADRRAGRLLSRPDDQRRWREGGGQRGQRDRRSTPSWRCSW